MDEAEEREIGRLVRTQRWAALATVHKGKPYASMVSYAAEQNFESILLHLSRLAPHTRNLLQNPEAALLIAEPDPGRGDPQTLGRLTIEGEVRPIERETAGYEEAREWYLRRLPDAEGLFEFSDFQLFRLVPTKARYVGGFARAHSLTPAQLREAALAGQR